MSFLKEFQDFLMRGNVIDLAVAFVVGAAVTSVVTGLVTDIITPLIGVAGHLNFSSLQFSINNSTFLVGTFINAVISFIIIVAVVFFLIVKPMSKLKQMHDSKKPAAVPNTKQCPECLSTIPLKAKRCAFCTSKVE